MACGRCSIQFLQGSAISRMSWATRRSCEETAGFIVSQAIASLLLTLTGMHSCCSSHCDFLAPHLSMAAQLQTGRYFPRILQPWSPICVI